MKATKDAILSQIELLQTELTERVKEVSEIKSRVDKKIGTWTRNDITQVEGLRRDTLMLKEEIHRLKAKIA